MPVTAHKLANVSGYDIAYSRARQSIVGWDVLTSRALQHTLPYSMPNQASNQAVYSLYMQLQHVIGWCPLAVNQARNELGYSGLGQHQARNELGYSDLGQHQARNELAYGALSQHQLQLTAPYNVNTNNAAKSEISYDLEDLAQLRVRSTLVYSVLSTIVPRSVVNMPQFTWHGVQVPLLSADLSCDEASSVWIATLELAGMSVFSNIQIKDEILLDVTVAVGTELFKFIVGAKQLGRPGASDVRSSLLLISPLALKDAPFAANSDVSYPGPTLASVIVTELIGAVTWSMLDWVVPAGEAVFTSMTPLRVALRIVEAAGGLIESNPDGTVVCRLRHPVDVPNYYTEPAVYSLFDSDVISSSSALGTLLKHNRVTISNSAEAAKSSDTVESIAHPDYPTDNTLQRVRAYLHTARPVTLVHTGNAGVTIASKGDQLRTEKEVVEFISGIAQTRYNIDSITLMTWQAVNLGSVTFTGTKLTSSVIGYSLLAITYTVKSLDWDVGLDLTQEAQFIITDT